MTIFNIVPTQLFYLQMLILDLVRVTEGEDNSRLCYKFKQLHARTEKGPVTALCSVNGYLLAAVGSKVYKCA